APPPGLRRLQIRRRDLAAARIALQLEAEPLPFAQRAQARALNRRDVHEDILRAVLRLNEAVAFACVKPFYDTDRHLFFQVVVAAEGDRARGPTSAGDRKARSGGKCRLRTSRTTTRSTGGR